jgi:hypothetical protein
MRTITTFLLLLVATVTPSLAQTKSPISEISGYTADVDRFVRATKKHRIFADVAKEDDKQEIWKEFKSNKELEEHDYYTQVFVWTKAGKVIAANHVFTSPSGDWAHYVNYYFRADGSLAKIKAELRTFYGDLIVLRDRYYDANGKLLKSTKKFRDLTTGKPKKPTDFFDQEIPVYLKLSALPFRKLL